MSRRITRFFSIMLAVMLLLQMSDLGMAFAANAPDPTAGMVLTVPEDLQDGNNYFFIRESGLTISEKSEDQLYIPVQRAGNLEEEAEVTLKIVDLAAHFGENYEAKILDERVKPELVYGGEAVIDVIQSATDQQEVETTDENEFGEAIHEAGSVELLDAYGNPVGTVTASPTDENGNPVREEEQTESADEASAEAAAGSTAAHGSIADSLSAQADMMAGEEAAGEDAVVYEPDGSSGTDALRGARDAFTGTLSDRQEMAFSEDLLSQMNGVAAPEGMEQQQLDLVKDDYPGRAFLLHFDAGEEVKFLVITPKYSEKAEGNCDLMAMLMNPSDNMLMPQGYFMTNVTILDEDEPESGDDRRRRQ